jgi:general secretion pathway protein K
MRAPPHPREGAALIVSLWVLLILALIVATFAYDMRIESEVTVYARNRFKAQYLARAGVEWARAALAKKVTQPAEGEALDLEEDDDEQMAIAALNLSKGVGISAVKKDLGEGFFEISLLPEEGRRNVNRLADEDWEEVLDQANVPEELWPELIDCFNDWMDPGDEHRLNGAETDDSFYKDKGYEVKNAPLDTVDELLLIKGFTEGVVYGQPSEDEDEEPMLGIAQWLTTYGDGRVNVNTASREVLMTVPGIDEEIVDEIIEKRPGLDGEQNTIDDGIEDLGQIPGLTPEVSARLTTTERKYIRVISIGDVHDVRAGIWAIIQVAEGGKVTPVFWREEIMQ